jgi:hypothetical protein
MSEDPVSRLAVARQEIDRVFGPGYAAAHPDVVTAVMLTAATDFATLAIARALDHIAMALMETEPIKNEAGIMRAHELMAHEVIVPR